MCAPAPINSRVVDTASWLNKGHPRHHFDIRLTLFAVFEYVWFFSVAELKSAEVEVSWIVILELECCNSVSQ